MEPLESKPTHQKPKTKGKAKTCAKTIKDSSKPASNLSKPASNLSKPASNLSKPVPNPTLSVKQQLFILEYLVDKNATQAAIRAGYSKRTANRIATENLSKPVIKAAIEAEIERRKERILVSADQVVKELAMIGLADMGDFVKVDSGGAVQVIPLEELPEGKSRIVKKIREKRTIKTVQGTKDRPDGEQILECNLEFELCDKVKSLELLSKHLGLLNDKQEMPSEITLKVVYDSGKSQKA